MRDMGPAERKIILVRMPNWLGDIVMSFSFLATLRQHFPHHRIVAITKPVYAPLLDMLSISVESLEFDKKTHRGLRSFLSFCKNKIGMLQPDVYFALPPSFSSALMGRLSGARECIGYRSEFRQFLLSSSGPFPHGKHRSQEYLDLISLWLKQNVTHSKFELNVPSAESEFLQVLKAEPYIVINPNSEASSRRLPLTKWVELLSALWPAGSVATPMIVGIGTAAEARQSDDVFAVLPKRFRTRNLSGKTNIVELASVLTHAGLVISNDSGPAHLAAAMGAPVAVFFGAGDPKSTAPISNGAAVTVLNQKLKCSPCLKNTCPLSTVECLATMDMKWAAEKISDYCKGLPEKFVP